MNIFAAPEHAASADAVPYEPAREHIDAPENDGEAANNGPDDRWQFWEAQIKAAKEYERRWRQEAAECEDLYFGPDDDATLRAASSTGGTNTKISEKTALIHANIDVLKPLLFSETPQPVVRRRFQGDGDSQDETALMVAEAAQRVAQYIVDTTKFDKAIKQARDDFLIAGRGAARCHYRPVFGTDENGFEVVADETVKPEGLGWRSVVMAACDDWDKLPWLAFDVPTTKGEIEAKFGSEIAEVMSFTRPGIVDTKTGMPTHPNSPSAQDTGGFGSSTDTEQPISSPFDTAPVFEIWVIQERRVVWWSPNYTEGVLDEVDDPLGLEEFWPMPEPLLAATAGKSMRPRPDIKYYERRADEVERASEKLRTILKTLSISGLFPGEMSDEVKKLLDGTNTMIPVAAWLRLIEKGGTNNIIQWLPIEAMIKAAQALITMRNFAKDAMFEASGVSDIMRAQGDPNETATAQQIKGRYAGLRLADKQRMIALFARDLLRIMLEIAFEHFSTKKLSEITNLTLPMTEAERLMLVAQQEAVMSEYKAKMQMHTMVAQAIEAGQLAGPIPPEPPKPEEKRIPATSWEMVHARLRSDFGRKISLTIETESTVLTDQQEDKEARIEFLSAFATFVNELAPLAGSGAFDFKTVKELLLFGVRGFPQSRTLESLIASLPDDAEEQQKPPEDPSIAVAKIKAEVDLQLAKMRHEHEANMKGVDVMAKGAEMAAQNDTPPQQPEPAQA